MKVFVTGLAGFVGSHFARACLERGWSVLGVDNLRTGSRANVPAGAEFHEGDIRDAATWHAMGCAAGSVDVVVHLAAQTSGERSFEIPDYDLQTNVQGSYNTYEFSRRANARLLINMSSMSVYGDVRIDRPVSEERPPEPKSPYGNSKLSAERLLSLLGEANGIPVVNLRLFNAYGPAQNLGDLKQGMVSIYLAYFLLDHAEVVVKGDQSRRRDFIYIDDIVSALLAVIDAPTPHPGSYNVCTGRATTVEALLAELRSTTGSTKPVVRGESTFGDVFGFPGDPSLFSRTFQWRPKVGLTDGIRRMVSSYTARNR